MAHPKPRCTPMFDKLIHEPIRLRILSVLAMHGAVSFTALRERLDATDGNISVHASKLEHAGYLASNKAFVGRKPVTHFEITDEGVAALGGYLEQMDDLIEALAHTVEHGIEPLPEEVRAEASREPREPRHPSDPELLARFMALVEVDDESGCWMWMGTVNHHVGYGRFAWDGVQDYAHRFSHIAHKGEIPKGMHTDHLCRVQRCVNPEHLEVVTPAENMRRSPFWVDGSWVWSRRPRKNLAESRSAA